jgi:hypothetical protein
MSIKLNVGGTTFEVLRMTLCDSEYFKNLLDDIPLNDESLFIDRDPNIFKHILNYLRDPFYAYPLEYVYLLDYYLIKHNFIQIITIQTSDKTFKTTQKVLTESPYFRDLFKKQAITPIIFIDTSGEVFEHVLEYLQNHRYPIPKDFVYALELYGIHHNIATPEEYSMKINVGGTIFEMSESISDKIPRLRYLYANKNDMVYDKNNVPFVDGSPKVFKHILEHMRNRKYTIPKKYLYGIDFWFKCHLFEYRYTPECMALKCDRIVDTSKCGFNVCQMHTDTCLAADCRERSTYAFCRAHEYFNK